MKPKHGQINQQHDANIHRECRHQAKIFSEKKIESADGSRDDGIDCASFNFLTYESNPDKDRDHDPDHVDRCQSCIEHDFAMLQDGELGQNGRSTNQEDSEQEQVIENLVPEILSKGVQGNDGYGPHGNTLVLPRPSPGSRNSSSRDRFCGVTEISRPRWSVTSARTFPTQS